MAEPGMPATYHCVLSIWEVITFEIPFNGTVKGTMFWDGRSIVGCQMYV